MSLETVIEAWHDAVNRRDRPAARAAVTDPVDVSGPRGAGPIPADDFAGWVTGSGITLRPVSWHPVDAATMVVEQEATWPGTEDGPVRVATLFRVTGGAVSLAHRFADLDEALRAAAPR